MKHVDYRAEKWKFWAVGFNDGAPSWTDEGRWCEFDDIHNMDLISEVYVSDTPPDALEDNMRKFMSRTGPDWGLKPIELSPETKTLRDEFASDWMKGVLANPNQSDSDPESFACMAYRMADAMMEARKK